MTNNTIINTTKLIYPQIYAYITPNYPKNEGWIKIGYTIHQDVDIRIRQQTQTANIDYLKLWAKPAKKTNTSDDWFKDTDFHAYLRKYKNVKQRPSTEWFFYNGTPEKALADFDDFSGDNLSQTKEALNYQLRAEQLAAIEQTLQYAKNNPQGEFLWNAKPRFGKTLTTYDFARQLDAHKVLIVTNRPAIANSWFDDFEKFIAWQTDFAFVSTSDSLKDRPVMTRDEFLAQRLNGKKRMLAFISLQDLKGAISFGGSYDKLKWVKDLSWDLLVIDESHEGVDTFKTDIAFENINRKFTLHLSGTPFKAVASGKFGQDEIYNWTYADEQQAKANWSNVEENNPYQQLPRLNLFSYQMSQMITDTVNQGAQLNGQNIDYAFDLNEFFETNDKGNFVHEADVQKWLNALSRNEKYPFSTKELRNELKHTFWLLNRVASAKALQKLLQNHPVFENYEVILAAGDGRTNEDDQTINQTSFNRVKEAIAKHDKTITLSVGQLSTGVTIPEWTAVLMLSNIKSPSLYMQAAFRAQNPWAYPVNGHMRQKENAYVFDFAPERTLTIYDEFANNLSRKTSNGGGTSDNRKDNIKQLLNFFPVIAEDNQGKMVELDVNQVLTIPKAIKAQEVVRRGFMSNLLFNNVSGIFASPEVRQILEQLNPVDVGKTTPRQTEELIDTQGVEVDNEGDVVVAQEIVIEQTNARFGEKIYGKITASVENIANTTSQNLSNVVASAFKENTQAEVIALAKEQGLSAKAAEQVVQQSANSIAKEIETVQKQADIKRKEAEVEYKKVVAESHHDVAKVEQAKAVYEATQKHIEDDFKKDLVATVEAKSKELIQQSTQTILEKAEDKKKNTVEDDVRARLRGFARTIPSFLMAYGTPSTTLANFDSTIKASVFKEVTGISLADFRVLRDKHHFFDEMVFNESLQEFLNKRRELGNYFDTTQQEDIFDYIPPQQTNQIFTPKKVVKLMIDKMEAEDPNLFKDPHKTFADLYVKSGLYLTEIVKRLYVGLVDKIPDSDARLKHILEQQVYGFAPSEIIYHIARNFVFGFDQKAKHINHAHIVCLDTTPYAKGQGDFEATCKQFFGAKQMKFDAVVGNPPYQEISLVNNKQDAVYNYFYDLAEKISPKYCLISPARFLFNAGLTSKVWNQKMLNDEHLKVVYFNQDSSQVFPNTDIKGGVAVLYRDTKMTFGAITNFVPDENLRNIASKFNPEPSKNLPSIMFGGRSDLKFNNKFLEDYPSSPQKRLEQIQRKHPEVLVLGTNEEYELKSSTFDSLDYVFLEKEPKNSYNYWKLLGLYNGERTYRWIEKKYMEARYPKSNNLEKFKVFVPKANGSGAMGEVLSTPLIGMPSMSATPTFISIGAFDTKIEAENLLKYIKSKFARALLGILKITQDNPPLKWAYIPLQDFTPNSDIDWSKSIAQIDQQLYAKYGLNQEEIDFIESKVKAMD